MPYESALGIERLCTIKEISERAGVGFATVHRVLKGHRMVASATAQRVLDAIEDLNSQKASRAFQGPPKSGGGLPIARGSGGFASERGPGSASGEGSLTIDTGRAIRSERRSGNI